MISNKRGFTLVELLVVVAMISIILGAMITSVSAAQERARIQKATAEVKAITQAILGYENHSRTHELPPMTDQDADESSLGFLLGNGETSSTGEKIPVLLNAAVGGGKVKDPWGTPYKIKIRKGDQSVKIESATMNMMTGYYLPNFYRVSAVERADSGAVTVKRGEAAFGE